MSEFTTKEAAHAFEVITKGATPLIKTFWDYFLHLVETPRPSFHLDQVVAYIASVAAKHGWECSVDRFQNLLIQVPASRPDLADAPAVCLQGHSDIVPGVAPGHTFNHRDEIIKVLLEPKGFIQADRTTLGADNGFGVAAALALAATPAIAHGPLEILITSNEEVGLLGANGLGDRRLKAKYLLNLDSEEEGVITIGCAGGLNVRSNFKVQRMVPDWKAKTVKLTITGLTGGHTGIEINSGRLSAIQAFGRAVRRAIKDGIGIRLVSINGGTAHNAICAHLEAVLAVDSNDVEAFDRVVTGELAKSFANHKKTDPEASCIIAVSDEDLGAPMSELDTRHIVDFALLAPFGPQRMSDAIPGMVERSFATTKVTTKDDDVEFLGSARSNVQSALDLPYQMFAALSELSCARVGAPEDAYPAWDPVDTQLARVAGQVMKRVYKKEAKFSGIHAGLECGVLIAKNPGLEAISIGPDMQDVHSASERLNIESSARTLEYLAELLEELAKTK